MNDGYAYNLYANPWQPFHSMPPAMPPAPTNPPNMQLARAYFVIQKYTDSFPPREALDKGTMFPELYSPWPTHHGKTM